MKTYFDIIKSHIKSHPPNYGDIEIQSILEMFWNIYSQHNHLNSAQIQDGFAELYRHMKDIPISDMDGIINIVCTLCCEHEKAGFVEGVKVGVRLGQDFCE